MGTLENKSAMVTGGSRGIGRAIALRLAADGAEVVLTYATNNAAAAEVVAAITTAGGRAYAIQADLRFPGVAQQLFGQAESMAGPLDILVNNAALASTGLLAGISDEDFSATIAVNLTSPFILMRDAAKRLRDGGRIINISTVNTVLISPGTAAYAASKGGLELLSRVAAAELGSRGITVNSVSPGATDTEMFRNSNPPEAYEQVAVITPMKRVGQPGEVADVVAFLAGPDARWVTGENIRASGGLG